MSVLATLHRPSPRGLPVVPRSGERAAADLIVRAREHERVGCVAEAIECYETAIAQAERDNLTPVLAEALRRLGVAWHQRDECEKARALVQRSFDVACKTGDNRLAGDALNSLGAMLLREGSLPAAQATFSRALAFGGEQRELRARVEQNLGIIANIQGDLDEALRRYMRALDDYRALGDEHGCAGLYQNLAMACADRQLYDEAEDYLSLALGVAERASDLRLKGLCLLELADVQAARTRHDDARRNAEAALAIFDQLGARVNKASAYRVIGVVYRETGRHALAESRLKSAIELAGATGSILNEAEAIRELAVTYQMMGRNQDALSCLNAAHALFGQLDARRDLVNVAGKMRALEETFLAVVLDWGQSIESSDTYTFGHCERVADTAVAVARTMGLSEQEVTTIRLGAYLHDVGKVKVPHEILNKPGPLTRDELDVVRMHTLWGIELLGDVEFPWDIKPIIRWHHERVDGAGYPDRLRGDEIPLSAQIVGIVDVFDALTTTRAYRGAMSVEQAVAEIARCRSAWTPEVFDAFLSVLGTGSITAPTPRLDVSPRAAA